MTRFFIGSINRPGPYFHATGEGLTTCALDESTGTITRLHVMQEVENVIWLTRAGPRLWAATERYLDPGEISALDLTDPGAPVRVGTHQSSHGGAVCHIAVTSDHRLAVVASYLGGVSVHEIGTDGAVAPAHQIVTYQGSGPNISRQEQAHPHQAVITPDGASVLVCDLGSDMIRAHRIKGRILGEAVGLPVPAGSGPRHLVFHPALPIFYLLGELDAVVRVYDASGPLPRLIASQPTLPPGFTGEPSGAAIKLHPSGKTLIISNRNSDTLEFFTIDPDGGLHPAATVPSGGRSPRDFAIAPSGRWLLALNQDSDNVLPVALDPATGLPTGRCGPVFACGAPVCAVF